MKYLFLTLMLPLLLTSCEDFKDRVEQIKNEHELRIQNSKKEYPDLNFYQGSYKGHQYIYNYGRYVFNFVHDPDCPCTKEKK